jgi:hypothetical protein
MSKKVRSEFEGPLNEIRNASAKLNRAADNATKEIEALEKELLEIEPGVEVWTPSIAETEEEMESDDGQRQTGKRVVRLGFSKVKKWGIAISSEVVDGDGKRVSKEETLLRKADRDLRLLGLEHLGDLLGALKDALGERASKLPSSEEGSAEETNTVEGDAETSAEADAASRVPAQYGGSATEAA